MAVSRLNLKTFFKLKFSLLNWFPVAGSAVVVAELKAVVVLVVAVAVDNSRGNSSKGSSCSWSARRTNSGTVPPTPTECSCSCNLRRTLTCCWAWSSFGTASEVRSSDRLVVAAGVDSIRNYLA